MTGDDIPGAGVAELDAGTRAFVWAVRAIACRRVCDARIAMGLGSLVPLKRAALTTTVLRRLLGSISASTHRAIAIGAAPAGGLSWDEAALLALFATDRADAARARVWLDRLGVASPGEALLRDWVLIAETFAENGAAPLIEGVTIPAQPRHEPEVRACAQRAAAVARDPIAAKPRRAGPRP